MAPTWQALLTIGTLLSAASIASAEDYLRSTSFDNCESSNQVNASSFDVVITPENRTIAFDIYGDITFSGIALLNFSIIIDGNETLLFRQDPCSAGSSTALCPTSPGQIVLNSNIEYPESASDRIPEEAYTTPDLDAQFRLSFINNATRQPFGCLEANLTNGVMEAANGTSSENNTSTAGTNTANDTNASNGTAEQGSQNSATTNSIMSTFAMSGLAVIAMTLWM